MRKHSPRKWLHAILDLVPVLIIGVFALYTTNKNATFNQSITITENKIVDFNQLNNNTESISLDNPNNRTFAYMLPNNLVLDNEYIFRFTLSDVVLGSSDNRLITKLGNTGSSDSGVLTNLSNGVFNLSFTISSGFVDSYYFAITSSSVGASCLISDINIFNLTQMFGVGNEPSVSDFNAIFPNTYDYVISEDVLIADYNITYDDTDIGSQMVYTLYNATDKYFNMNQVFNLQDVYNWVSINLFGGNPPLMASVVWNIIVYEFVIDLLFLFYAFFMFIIDFIEYLLDKPFSKARGK